MGGRGEFRVRLLTPQRYWRVTHTDGRQWRVTFRPLTTVGVGYVGYYVVNRTTARRFHGAQLRPGGRLFRAVVNAVLDSDASAPREVALRSEQS